MNAARRKQVAAIVQQLNNAIEAIEASALTDAEQVASDEREAFDNMPESLQDTDRGQAVSAAADALEEAQGSIEEARDALNAAIEKYAEAA